MDHSTPGLPVHHQLRESTQLIAIESVMPYNHLILCIPLLFLPSIIPSIRVFSNKSALHIRWPKYRSFWFNISPFNEHSGSVGSSCSRRDSQESSPTPQLKSANSLVLSFLYGSILTSHMWYLYTVAYYFAIKRNAFDSVLMRWMNLEPTIQSEVSQKNKHHILMHIYGIQKDGTDRPIHSPS